MDDRTDFIAYCIEEYKFEERLTGRKVIDLFSEYHVLDYLRAYYEALHTAGGKYIVEDINLYINSRQSV